jgi:hypothetical protein
VPVNCVESSTGVDKSCHGVLVALYVLGSVSALPYILEPVGAMKILGLPHEIVAIVNLFIE